ncbi:MAG: hypothetical protein MSS51_07630 [Bacteroidales bacterium]|nr:hypothetical protein [Bacteroidales bacterium]
MAVVITIAGATGNDIAIEPDGVLEFAADDTVMIDSGVNDSLDVCQQHSCTIALHAATYVSDLFTSEYKDGKVEVSVNGTCVFSGWLEPRTLTQPFNDVYDDLSLQCVDSLSAMQYSNYKDVNNTTTYTAAAEKVGMRTFKDLLTEALSKGTDGGSYNVWWDSSRATETTDGNVFDELRVSDMAFLGESADDTVTYLDVAEAVLKYLDLHIVQYGSDFYVFSWDTMRAGTTSWSLLVSAGEETSQSAQLPVCTGVSTELSAPNVEDTDTKIDVQEIFNQLCLTVSPKGSDTVLRSPLDSTGKMPAMGARQYYCTEYAADGEGVKAARAFFSLVKNHADNGYDSQVWKDYLVRVMRNVYWKIGSGSGVGTAVTDWATDESFTYPEDAMDRLGGSLGALLLQVGSVDHKPGTGDTSKQSSVSMTDELVISVNGNGSDTFPYPTDTDIRQAMPLMSYVGGDTTASYSPDVADDTDGSYHNYLVIDGTIALTPLMPTAFEVEKVRGYNDGDAFFNRYGSDVIAPGVLTKALPSISASRVNKDGRYLAFEWWKNGLQTGTRKGYIPYTEDGSQQYEYKTASGKDEVDKVDILWCMLRIGDKVLVEDKTGNGAVGDFSWQTYKELSECADTDGYLEQTFTIGINPKIGDKLVGQDFDIGTNFDYTTNIDAEKGMAIPLPYDAKLHGRMTFQVLGIDNPVWADYHVTRHKTMFRHTKYGTDNIPLMAHVSSVIIKNFSVKVYSDVENGGEDDIVYMSRTSHKFYNKKDDLEMKIHSGFTSDEISRYGLSGKLMYTTVCGKDGLAITSITNKITGVSAKAEKLYVDAYYKELSNPRVVLTQNMQCRDMGVAQTSRWTHPALSGKTFYVRDIGYNLMEGSAQAKMEEVF